MSTSVSFLSDPHYGTSLVLFVLSPPGIPYDANAIAKNLYGKRACDLEAITLPGFAPKNGFRFSETSLHWPDFLEISFQHSDHALFFIPGKQKFQEIRKENLLQQNPDLYAFSFYRITCPSFEVDAPKEEVTQEAERPQLPADKLQQAQSALSGLLEAGWSANAVSKVSGINPITIGNIRHDRQNSISDRVSSTLLQLKADYDAGKVQMPARKRGGGAKQSVPGNGLARKNPAGPRASAVKSPEKKAPAVKEPASDQPPRYVAVDAEKFSALLDRMITTFTEAVDDLKMLKEML